MLLLFFVPELNLLNLGFDLEAVGFTSESLMAPSSFSICDFSKWNHSDKSIGHLFKEIKQALKSIQLPVELTYSSDFTGKNFGTFKKELALLKEVYKVGTVGLHAKVPRLLRHATQTPR